MLFILNLLFNILAAQRSNYQPIKLVDLQPNQCFSLKTKESCDGQLKSFIVSSSGSVDCWNAAYRKRNKKMPPDEISGLLKATKTLAICPRTTFSSEHLLGNSITLKTKPNRIASQLVASMNRLTNVHRIFNLTKCISYWQGHPPPKHIRWIIFSNWFFLFDSLPMQQFFFRCFHSLCWGFVNGQVQWLHVRTQREIPQCP